MTKYEINKFAKHSRSQFCMQTHKDGHFAHKVVLLGDSRVGKTSIIFQQLHGCQPSEQNPTIGCTCTEVTFHIDNKIISLQIWDTAGQEIYRSLVPVYVRGAQAALVVYDITDYKSFQGMDKWFTLLDDTVAPGIPVFVVGNKTDLADQRVIDDAIAETFAKAHNAKFCTVCARKGDGIGKLFEDVARCIVRTSVTETVPKLIEQPTEENSCC